MFSRRICRPDGFAPNKKRKASEHELADRIDGTPEPSLAISVTRRSARPTRRSLSGGTKLLRGGLA
jgi:hypothetical protein